MIPLPLELIAPLGRLNARPWADEVSGLQIDSRRIEEGDLFVAVGGGRDFVAHALARGAAAALVPDDAHTALATIAGAVRERSDARVVAITGAVGKTTTRQILAALCAPHLRTVATEANYNNELGVPLTLCRLEPASELCIVELGMRGLGQIAWLAAFVRPQIGVITNVAPVHLELLGSVENVARAKAELIAALPSGGAAVVADDPLLDPYLDRPDLEIRRVGRVEDPGTYLVAGRSVRLETSYRARHQLDNTLVALNVCDLLGVPLPATLEVDFGPLRDELVELPNGVLLLNDCYNANPASMRAALAHLAELAAGRRRLAVLGEMAELGERARELHRELAAAVDGAGIAELVAVGALAREYAAPGSVHATFAANPEEAVAALRGLLAPGDVVLVKGSRAAGLEAVVANLRD